MTGGGERPSHTMGYKDVNQIGKGLINLLPIGLPPAFLISQKSVSKSRFLPASPRGEAKGAARRRTAEQSIGKGGMVGMENNKIRKSIMLIIFKEETK